MLIFSLGFCKLLGSCFPAWEMQFSSCTHLTQCLPLHSDCICVFINVIETCSFPQVFSGSFLIICWYFPTFHIAITRQGYLLMKREEVPQRKGRELSAHSERRGGGGGWGWGVGSGQFPAGCSRQQPSESAACTSELECPKRFMWTSVTLTPDRGFIYKRQQISLFPSWSPNYKSKGLLVT